MKTHPDNAAVLEKACGVLVSLALNNTDNKVAIAAAGGIAVRIAALEHRLSDPPSAYPLRHPQPNPNYNTMTPNLSISQTVTLTLTLNPTIPITFHKLNL